MGNPGKSLMEFKGPILNPFQHQKRTKYSQVFPAMHFSEGAANEDYEFASASNIMDASSYLSLLLEKRLLAFDPNTVRDKVLRKDGKVLTVKPEEREAAPDFEKIQLYFYDESKGAGSREKLFFENREDP